MSKCLESRKNAAQSPRRTKADWAREVVDLLEGRYADRERITLVSDNLNTHTRGRLLRSVRADPGARAGAAHRVLRHAETRQLAERRGKRT